MFGSAPARSSARLRACPAASWEPSASWAIASSRNACARQSGHANDTELSRTGASASTAAPWLSLSNYDVNKVKVSKLFDQFGFYAADSTLGDSWPIEHARLCRAVLARDSCSRSRRLLRWTE